MRTDGRICLNRTLLGEAGKTSEYGILVAVLTLGLLISIGTLSMSVERTFERAGQELDLGGASSLGNDNENEADENSDPKENSNESRKRKHSTSSRLVLSLCSTRFVTNQEQ